MLGLLRDPAAWSVLIAVSALVLSQVAPLRQILRGRHLRVALPRQFFLWHTLGNLQVDIVVGIRNTGGRDAYISHIDCYILDSEGRKWKLSAQSYVPASSATSGTPAPELAFSGLAISPDQFWSQTLRCYEDIDEADQRQLEGIYDKFYSSGVSDTALPTDGSVPEAPQAVADEARAYFRRRFMLVRGTYRLVIAAMTQSRAGVNDVAGTAGCEFIMIESNITKLRSIVHQYQYGFGITRVSANPVLGNSLVSVKPLGADATTASYRAATHSRHGS